MFTTRSSLADTETVLVFWLFAVFQWMCWSTIISKGQTEKLVFSIPILIIFQVYFRRLNVTNFFNPCLCGRQRGQDGLCMFQLLLSPLRVFFSVSGLTLFLAGSFFHKVWFVDTRILTCLGAMTHPQKVWLLWGLLLLMYAINCDAVPFISSCIPCLLSCSFMGRRKKNCSLLFKINHFKGSFVPLGAQMIFSKQITILCLFFLYGSLKIQAAVRDNSQHGSNNMTMAGHIQHLQIMLKSGIYSWPC